MARRRVSLQDIERGRVRQRFAFDDIVLEVPTNKLSILWWWIECEEINPLTPDAYYAYTAHVDLQYAVSEWCDEHLSGYPTFSKCCFELPHYEATLRPVIEDSHVALHFLSEAEATLFKLRWF